MKAVRGVWRARWMRWMMIFVVMLLAYSAAHDVAEAFIVSRYLCGGQWYSKWIPNTCRRALGDVSHGVVFLLAQTALSQALDALWAVALDPRVAVPVMVVLLFSEVPSLRRRARALRLARSFRSFQT